MRLQPRSIAWRLQFWHAAILLAVVAGLSVVWFLQARSARLNKVDSELLSAARVLDGSLRGFRLSGPGGGEGLVRKGLTPGESRRLSLPRGLAEEASQNFYFALWLGDGRLLKAEGLPPELGVQFDRSLRDVRFSTPQETPFREVRLVGPTGSQILVGRSLSKELRGLRRLALQITILALGVLAVGVVGGWWLARAVLGPIAEMSETASRFSALDMSPRVNVVEADSELGELATILNQAFDRIEGSFAQQRRFAADASHELRTPLAVIQSQIELALKRERTPDAYVKTLKTCVAACERLSDLVDSLLTLARLDSAQGPGKGTPVRLDLVAAKCVDLMRPVAVHAEVELECVLEPAKLLGDREGLERAVLNLLKNGIAYNRAQGRVSVTLASLEDGLELALRDTGVGISEADLARVRERFYRVDPARSRQHGGSGLGLSIVEKIVEAHGGALEISSELGHGTLVVIRLPHAPDEDSPSSSGGPLDSPAGFP